MAATILSPADIAAEFGTDARTVRKFLRSITPKDSHPGKGSRWGIEKKNLRSMRSKFTAFQNAENEKKAQRENAKNEAKNENSPAVSLVKDYIDENGNDTRENDPTDDEIFALENALDNEN